MLRIVIALLLMIGTAHAQSVLSPGQGGTANNNSGAVPGDVANFGPSGALGDSGTLLTKLGVGALGIDCSLYSSLAACATAATPGTVMFLAPNTTYALTSTFAVSTPNVTVSCPSWNTIIQRGSGMTGATKVVWLSGAGDRIMNCTIDGNNVAGATNADLQLSGAHDLSYNNQIINSAGVIALALSGAYSASSYDTVIENSPNTNTYGIWGIGGVTVSVDHAYVTGTGIDAVGISGPGSIVSNSYVGGNHCYTSQAGGQIALYPSASGTRAENNYIAQGCSNVSVGIEANANNSSIVGNTVTKQYGSGIAIDPSTAYVNVTGNSVYDSGQYTGGSTSYGMIVQSGATHIAVVGNKFIDDQGTPTQNYGFGVTTGAQDYIDVTGNEIYGNTLGAITDTSTGTHKSYVSNLGVAGYSDTQTFASNGTWTKPAFCSYANVTCTTRLRIIGGGGGGGSGGQAALGTVVSGGASGGGGACLDIMAAASQFTATVTVSVGSGGTGGAAQTSGAGNFGTAGTQTTFGSYFTAYPGGGSAGGQIAAASGAGAAGGTSIAGQSETSSTSSAGNAPGGSAAPNAAAPSYGAQNVGGQMASVGGSQSSFSGPCVGGSASGGTLLTSTSTAGGYGGGTPGASGANPGSGASSGTAGAGGNANSNGTQFPNTSGAAGGGSNTGGAGGLGGGIGTNTYGCGGAGGGPGTTQGGSGGNACGGYAVAVTTGT